MKDEETRIHYSAAEMRNAILGPLENMFPLGSVNEFLKKDAQTIRLMKKDELFDDEAWGILAGHGNNRHLIVKYYPDSAELTINFKWSRYESREPLFEVWKRQADKFVREGEETFTILSNNMDGPRKMEITMPLQIDTLLIENFNPLGVFAHREKYNQNATIEA